MSSSPRKVVKKEANTSGDLHEDIILDIVSRIPAKTVGSFKCMSKRWRNLLSNREFIKYHRGRQKEQNVLFFSDYSNLFYTTGDKAVVIPFPREFGCKPNMLMRTICTCHGLILVKSGLHCNYCLFNPVIRRHLLVPGPPLRTVRFYRHFGFGYDHINEDYKIGVVHYSCDNVKDGFINVYSVKTGVWREIPIKQDSGKYRVVVGRSCIPFIDGALHWLVMDDNKCLAILAFDLTHEKFREIQIPQSCINHYVYLILYKDCLCVIELQNDYKEMSVWIMKQYGSEDSWTKLFTLECLVEHRIVPLCFVGDKEFVLFSSARKRVIIYNFEDSTFKDLLPDWKGIVSCYNGGMFTETLVWPSSSSEVIPT